MIKREFYRLEDENEKEKFYYSLAENASEEKGIIFITEYMAEKGFSEVRKGRVYYTLGCVVRNNKNPFLDPVEVIGEGKDGRKKAVSKLEKLTGFKLKLVGKGN